MITFIFWASLALAIIIGVRFAYIYCLSWKWSQMIIHYLDHAEDYHVIDYVRNRAEEAYKIPMKWRVALDLGNWDWKAENLYESKSNPRLWLEITSHWYDKFEE